MNLHTVLYYEVLINSCTLSMNSTIQQYGVLDGIKVGRMRKQQQMQAPFFLNGFLIAAVITWGYQTLAPSLFQSGLCQWLVVQGVSRSLWYWTVVATSIPLVLRLLLLGLQWFLQLSSLQMAIVDYPAFGCIRHSNKSPFDNFKKTSCTRNILDFLFLFIYASIYYFMFGFIYF